MTDKKAVFISKAQKTHGDKFDYSLVEYVNSATKIKIICPIHGVFEQTPAEHVRGRGCWKCHLDGPRNFLIKAKKVHGDKYDYSKVNYVRHSVEVEIICPTHGSFYQTPVCHLTGCGCQKCGRERANQSMTFDTAQFIENAKAVHGDRYDYTDCEYVKADVKVAIRCSEHGVFYMAPNNHVSQKQGCPRCARFEHRLTTEEFIARAKSVHGDKYDYSLANYKSYNDRIEIICPVHGVFKQKVIRHLDGRCCPNCAVTKKMDQQKFLLRARKKHGNRYSYDKAVYININSPMTVTCPKHGDFTTTAHWHLNSGAGCPHCRASKGEIKIRNYLDANGISYKAQWTFRSLKRLKFDFVIWFNKTMYVVEYQGRQHYLPHSWGKDKSPAKKAANLRVVRERDARKRKWCKQKHLHLLEVPYWDFDRVEEIVNDFINNKTPKIGDPPQVVVKYMEAA